MREIIFRRCRLEIPNTGLVNLLRGPTDKDGPKGLELYPPDQSIVPEAAFFGFKTDAENLIQFHVHFLIGCVFISDCFDDDQVYTERNLHNLVIEPDLPDFGVWAGMSKMWYDRLRAGWQHWPHGMPVDARTVTGFIGSAIRADLRDGQSDAETPPTNVDGGK